MVSGPCGPAEAGRYPPLGAASLFLSEDFSSAAEPAADLFRASHALQPFSLFVLLLSPLTPSDSGVAS